MNTKFWTLVKANFVRANNIIAGVVCGGLLMLLLWALKPEMAVELRIVVPVLFVMTVAIMTLGNALADSIRTGVHMLPKVQCIRQRQKDVGTESIYLLEPSELFGYGISVSIYYTDESNFEQLIGIGVVRNIQEDRRIQVVLTETVEEHRDIIEKLEKNELGLLSKIRVKPSVLESSMRAK